MNKMVHSLWYGIGTCLPVVLIIMPFIGTFLIMLTGNEDTIPMPFGIAMVLFSLLAVALCWFYIITMMIDAARHYKGTTMVIWIILIYMCNVFIFPAYWFGCIRKRTDEY